MYYLVDSVSALVTGWTADFYIRKGRSPTLTRKSAMAIGHTLGAIGIIGCALAGTESYLIWLAVAGAGSGAIGAGIFAFPQTLAGKHGAGKWVGLQNAVANLAGVAAPALTGFVVARTSSFFIPFAVTSALLVIGALGWVLGVGKLEPVKWGTGHLLRHASPPVQVAE